MSQKARIILARIVAVGGLFVTGGDALGFVPERYQHAVAVVAAIVVYAASHLPSIWDKVDPPTSPVNGAGTTTSS